MAFGPPDRLRLGCAVNAVMLLGEVEPGDPHRTVGPGRKHLLGLVRILPLEPAQPLRRPRRGDTETGADSTAPLDRDEDEEERDATSPTAADPGTAESPRRDGRD